MWKILLTNNKLTLVETIKNHRFFCDNIWNKKFVSVSQFCNLNVNLPCNVQLSLIDVHKYHNNDRLIIESPSEISNFIEYSKSGDDVEIFSKRKFIENGICHVKIPVKANVNVFAQGKVTANNCGGELLKLKSQNGNVCINKFSGGNMDLETSNGNIYLNGAVVATSLKALTHNGEIKTDRIQSLQVSLKSYNGHIAVDSSYCDDALIEANNGNLHLKNIHKKAKLIAHNGNLKLSGVDGEIDVNVVCGSAEIQISRILNNSNINVPVETLLLKLSEDCLDSACFNIHSKSTEIDQSLRPFIHSNGGGLKLGAKATSSQQVDINCKDIKIEMASWADMFQLKKVVE